MAITLGGFFSGLDTQNIIAQLTAINRIPINNLEAEKAALDEQNSAFGFIKSSLENLKNQLAALDESEDFEKKAITSSDSTIGAATVDSTGVAGSYSLNITQVATSSIYTGAKARSVPTDADTVSDIFGSSASGTFLINGVEITLDGTETLNNGAGSVVDKINTAMAAASKTITASFASGNFTISDGSETILLAGGTSNFLEQAQLFNNGTTSVTSANPVGRLSAGTALSAQSLATSLNASGSIVINGTSVSYTDSDTLQEVLDRITLSDAGVTATYDSYSDKVLLTSNTRGANAITVADADGGNLSAALNLDNGSLSIGNTTKFTVDGGATRESQDATLTASELGIGGVTFVASATGTTTLDVSVDTATIQSQIEGLIEQYNGTQNLIDSYVKINTDDPDQSGILASEGTLTFLPVDLRTALGGAIYSSGTAIQTIEDIGIRGNSSDNTISLSDSTELADALKNHLDEVIALFTDSSNGIVARLESQLDAYGTGFNSIIDVKQDSIVDQKEFIDREIDLLELRVEAERTYLESSFALLESAQSQSSAFSGIISGAQSSTLLGSSSG